ncbi:MAG: HupE/UreJ family protein [Candidatus Thiodiazotropha sp. 6PLUC7]
MINGLRTTVTWILLVTPNLAFAHSSVHGLNSFINGLLHPLFVPSHLLLLIALGLYLGQQESNNNLNTLKIFLTSSVVGVAASAYATGCEVDIILLGETLIIGLLVATKPSLTQHWHLFFGASAGFILGLDSVHDTVAGVDKLISLLGSLVGLSMLLLQPMAFADYFKKHSWQKVGIRVLGSWVAASALLVFALTVSTRASI